MKCHTFVFVPLPSPPDVVRAYRGVLKEKEALEKTLKALSVRQEEEVVEEEEGEGELQGQGAGERDGNKTPQNEEVAKIVCVCVCEKGVSTSSTYKLSFLCCG